MNNPYPYMSEEDVEFIKNEFLKYKKGINILEWGAGNSTFYFTNFLRANGVDFQWDAIEYNKLWYDRVENFKLGKRVRLFLYEEKDLGDQALFKAPMDDYVNLKGVEHQGYNIIIIDGRKRRRCLFQAFKIAVPCGATVLLHDAERKHYHCALKDYKDGKYLTKTLWMGETN